MCKSKFYVTTPIYYVNDQPHIGHAYTTILADVLARYHRLTGTPTFFLTGTDEHGQKVLRAAEKAGMTPIQQADSTVVRFQALWKKLGITHDDFIRTTEERHQKVVQGILQDLYDRNEIYRADYDGWYCVTCERFYMEKDLVDQKCPEAGCGRPVDRIRETNYFFRMSKYQDWLIQYIHDHPKFIQPDFRKNETLGFLRKPLEDLCISRPKKRMGWGIELPFDNEFVTYVWFDALLNYVSAIGYGIAPDKFNQWWPASCQLIGKDILTTHTVYWPTMLRSIGVPMPETVFAHGWWLVGRDKMSKTTGNVVDPMEFVSRFGADTFRYFLMAEMSLGQDASFTEEAFVRRYNTDLANDLGNLVSRVMKLIMVHMEGKIPACGPLGPDEEELQTLTIDGAKHMVRSVDDMRIDLGLAELAGVLRGTNRYLEKTQPWTLAKQGSKEKLGTVLFSAVEALRIVSGMLYPVMPEKMKELRACLGFPTGDPDFEKLVQWGGTTSGSSIGEMRSLFPRIETKPVVKTSPVDKVEKTGPIQSTLQAQAENEASIEDFQKLQLKTAKVLEAQRVEGADKLLRLQIQIGEETRQIVAGIALHYKPEDLIGRTIVVIANLKPAKIRGQESRGMLLAAGDGTQMKLLGVDGDLPSGCRVK